MKTTQTSPLILLLILLSPTWLKAQQQFNKIAPAQMQQELTLLKKALTSLHPGIYRYETPGQVDSLFRTYSQRLNKPLYNNEYFTGLSQLLTHIKCGHTYLNPWNQKTTVRNELFSKTFMPFLYRMIDKKMIVTHNLSYNNSVKRGDEIVSINNIPVKTIIDSLLSVSRSDGLHGQLKQLDNISIEPADIDTSDYTLFDIYFPLFFTANFKAGNYKLLVKPYGSKKNSLITVSSLSKAMRQAVYIKRFGVLPVREKNWSLRFIDPKTACLRIGDFETWEWKADYKKYLDSVFMVLKDRKIKNLVIDIRGNEGGDDEAREVVLSYLANKPFGCDNPMHRWYRFLSIPDSLAPYLTTWDKSFKKPKDPKEFIINTAGLYESKEDLNTPCESVTPKNNAFKGNKFLITDARNSSTSFTLASVFQQMGMGQIIGEPTSGNKQGINGGQFFFFNLPTSGFEMDIPLVWGAYPGGVSDRGIVPDRLVKTTQADIYYNRDVQLQYVIGRLNSRPK